MKIYFIFIMRREPAMLGRTIFAKNIQSDALNADAAETPTREKKNTAALSRTPRSPIEIGRSTALTKYTDEEQIAESKKETGSNAMEKI